MVSPTLDSLKNFAIIIGVYLIILDFVCFKRLHIHSGITEVTLRVYVWEKKFTLVENNEYANDVHKHGKTFQEVDELKY